MAEESVTQHTPGPWVAEDNIVFAQAYREIVMVNDGEGNEAPHDEGLLALVYSPRRDWSESNRFHENARLIAAAPDLLAALKDMTNRFKRCAMHAGSDEEFVDAAIAGAVAAIAKAEGRA